MVYPVSLKKDKDSHSNIKHPSIVRDLFVTDLTSWVAIMAHGMFYTDFVATAVYGGQPDAAPGSVYDLLFDEGVRRIF